MPHVSHLLDRSTDESLLPALLVLIDAKKSGYCVSNVKLVNDPDSIYDFYTHKNVHEVQKCLEVLDGLKIKCINLLNSWPDHPTLVKVSPIFLKEKNYIFFFK